VHPGPMWPRHILLSDTAVHPGPWSDAIQLSDSADEQLLPLATAVVSRIFSPLVGDTLYSINPPCPALGSYRVFGTKRTNYVTRKFGTAVCRFLVLGSWFLVLGSWFLVLGSWFLVLGSSWFLDLGVRLTWVRNTVY
jgi:hypothetical protein